MPRPRTRGRLFASTPHLVKSLLASGVAMLIRFVAPLPEEPFRWAGVFQVACEAKSAGCRLSGKPCGHSQPGRHIRRSASGLTMGVLRLTLGRRAGRELVGVGG